MNQRHGDGLMDVSTNEWMIDGVITKERVDWMDGEINKWMDGWMDGWMDRWMDG